MYLTYSDYTSLGGSLPQVQFNRFNAKAQDLITTVTHGRVEAEYPVRQNVKYAAYDVVSAMIEAADSGAETHEISSMSNDGVSVTYKTSASNPTTAVRVRYVSIIRSYLQSEVDKDGVPLMYVGVS